MTDVKPFARDEATPPSDRTVAVLLMFSGPAASEVPEPLASLGGACLFDLALQCMDHVSEAAERAVWTDDAALLERFEAHHPAGIRLLAAPPERAFQRGAPNALRSTHVLTLDGHYPLLRSNTIDEAIRLLQVRSDIEAITSCVRTQGVAYDLAGEPLAAFRNNDMMLVSCRAFLLVPVETISLGRQPDNPPYAFEIAESEAFRVSTPFSRDLVGPYLEARK